MRADTYHHRRANIVWIITLLSALFAVFAVAALFGPGFDASSGDLAWALILGTALAAIIAGFAWLLWRNPRVLVVSETGIDLPLTFRRPLRWDEIHRIRRLRGGRGLYGRHDWLIVEPLPGVLAPLRLPTWPRLELWLQRHHGVRIPLHGLEADPEAVVRSVARFRPVADEEG